MLIYLLTVVLAFCSLVYELLLGQTLAAFLGNTVLRYSVTIGLYMLSMGIGAFLVRGRVREQPVVSLQWVEIALTLLGGSGVALLFLLDAAGVPPFAFATIAHLLIVVIGILTGIELPLLMELRAAEVSGTEGIVLGWDYVGAFGGTIAFAFWFYPRVGLVPTAFAVAGLNALCGTALFLQGGRVPGERRGRHRALVGTQAVLLAAVVVCLVQAPVIGETLIRLYLGEGG